MCYSPIRVKNNKHGFNPLTDRLYNEVACGHCGECQTDKRRSYYLRCMCEREKMVLRVGNTKDTKVVNTAMCFFVTLTYNDKYLPKMLFPDGKIHSVFSHKDVSLFFHRLQIKLYRRGVSFHRICTCEYGHGDFYQDDKGRFRRGTYRPHYHILLFLDTVVNSQELQQLIRESWSTLVSKKGNINKYDSYGKVFFGRKGDGTVTGDGAIKYVCKYVVKFDNDSFFMRYYNDLKDYDINAMVAKLHHCEQYNIPVDNQLYNDLLFSYALKESLPFVHTSINFGAALDKVDNFEVNYELGKVYCYNDSFDSKVFSTGKKRQDVNSWVLPLYYRRKRNYITNSTPDYSRPSKPDIKVFSYSPFSYRLFNSVRTKSNSSLTPEHEQELFNSVSLRFHSLFDSYRAQVSSIVSTRFIDFYKHNYKKSLPLSNTDFVNITNDAFLLELAYYSMFNRGYIYHINFTDINNNFNLDTSFLFRSSADEMENQLFIDADTIENYENVLKIFRVYKSTAGSIRDKDFAEEYKLFKLKKSYENQL